MTAGAGPLRNTSDAPRPRMLACRARNDRASHHRAAPPSGETEAGVADLADATVTVSGLTLTAPESSATGSFRAIFAADDAAQDELAFRADIPNVGAKADRESERAQHQRRRLQQQLAKAVKRSDRLDEEHVKGCRRAFAQGAEQNKTGEQHGRRRDQRRGDAHGQGRLGTTFQAPRPPSK